MTRDERKLLKLIDAVPTGEKLPIGRFARELGASQSVLASMLQSLVDAGAVDRSSMRSSAEDDHQGSAVVSAADRLLAEIDAYCARTNTPPGYVGKVAFNHPGFVPLLRKRGTLRDESAEVVRQVLAKFPDGIAKKDALPPVCRRLLPRPVVPVVAVDDAGERISGKQLAAEIDAYIAAVPGLNRYRFSKAYNGGSSTVATFEHAAYPKPATVAKVRELIARGVDPLIPDDAALPISRAEREARGLPPSGRQVREDNNLGRHSEAQLILEDAKLTAQVAHEQRLPGESLADAVRRQASDREERFANATRLTTRHPLSQRPIDPDEFLDAPSAVLRRAQRDWPDQCARVKGIADEIGVTLGEAWRRVIAAGVECLSDPEAA